MIDGVALSPIPRLVTPETRIGDDTGMVSATTLPTLDLRQAIETGHAVAGQDNTSNDLGAGTGDAALKLDGHLTEEELASLGLPIALPRRRANSGPGATHAGPFEAIEWLCNDGETVVVSTNCDAELGPSLGGKMRYGHVISVTQVGAGGQDPAAGLPQFDVAFEFHSDLGVRSGGREPDPRSTSGQTVTTSFASKAEAARAVILLQREALAHALRMAGRFGAVERGPLPRSCNPLLDQLSDPWPGSAPAGGLAIENLAERVAPAASDRAWLRRHISRVCGRLGPALRGEGRLGQYGLDRLGLRTHVPGVLGLHRTVLYRHGSPHGLTYAVSGRLDDTGQLAGALTALCELSVGPSIRHVTAAATWDMPFPE